MSSLNIRLFNFLCIANAAILLCTYCTKLCLKCTDLLCPFQTILGVSFTCELNLGNSAALEPLPRLLFHLFLQMRSTFRLRVPICAPCSCVRVWLCSDRINKITFESAIAVIETLLLRHWSDCWQLPPFWHFLNLCKCTVHRGLQLSNIAWSSLLAALRDCVREHKLYGKVLAKIIDLWRLYWPTNCQSVSSCQREREYMLNMMAALVLTIWMTTIAFFYWSLACTLITEWLRHYLIFLYK